MLPRLLPVMQGLGAPVSPAALMGLSGRKESRSAVSAVDPGDLLRQFGRLTGFLPEKGVVADDLSRADRQNPSSLLC